MKIVIYCKIWPDGLGDFGHFKDIVQHLLESYGNALELIGLLLYDSQAHNPLFLQEELREYTSIPHFSWQLLNKPTREELDHCLLQIQNLDGIIAVSTPFYFSGHPYIKSLPILHLAEHEAASFPVDHRERESFEFDKWIFSMGLHEVSHGILLKQPPTRSSEELLTSLEEIKYRNLLLETSPTKNYSQFLKETLIVPLYVTQQATAFACQVIHSILISELAQPYQNIVFHTNFTGDQKDLLITLFEKHCSAIHFISHDGTVNTHPFSNSAHYKIIKVFLSYPLPFGDYQKLYQIAQEIAIGRGDKTLELILSNPNLIPIIEVQKAKALTFEAFNRYLIPSLFQEEEARSKIRSYISWLLRYSPHFERYPFKVKVEPNVDKNLESYLTLSFKPLWKEMSSFLKKKFDFTIKLDFYLLFFFKYIHENRSNKILKPEQAQSLCNLPLNENFDSQLAYTLLQIPEEARTSFIKKAALKLSNSYQLAALLILLPIEERYDFLTNATIPDWDSQLVEIFMHFVPKSKRWDLYSLYRTQIIDSIKNNLYTLRSIAALFPAEVQWNFINEISGQLINQLEQKNYYPLENILGCIPVGLRLQFISVFLSKNSKWKTTSKDLIVVLSCLTMEDRIEFFTSFSTEDFLKVSKEHFPSLIRYLPNEVDVMCQRLLESKAILSEIVPLAHLSIFLPLIKEKSNRDLFLNALLKEEAFVKSIKDHYSLIDVLKLFLDYEALPSLVEFLKKRDNLLSLKNSISERTLFSRLIDYMPQEYYQEFIDLFGGLECIIVGKLLELDALNKLSRTGFINLIHLLDEDRWRSILSEVAIHDTSYPLIKIIKGHSAKFINTLVTKLSKELSTTTFCDHNFMVVFSHFPKECHETLIRAIGAKKIVEDIGLETLLIHSNMQVEQAYRLALTLEKEKSLPTTPSLSTNNDLIFSSRSSLETHSQKSPFNTFRR